MTAAIIIFYKHTSMLSQSSAHNQNNISSSLQHKHHHNVQSAKMRKRCQIKRTKIVGNNRGLVNLTAGWKVDLSVTLLYKLNYNKTRSESACIYFVRVYTS